MYDPHGSVSEAYERVARRIPDGVAIELGERRVTYGELDQAADRLAQQLRHRGVERETCVGVLCGRSVEAVVAYVAVVKAGGAYVPLDPEAPSTRVRFQLEDVGARLVLTPERFGDRADGLGVPLLPIDGELRHPDGEPAERPATASAGRDLLYVLYTSGSTGRPKGVAVEHRGVLRLLYGVPAIQAREGEGVLNATGLDFDVSTREIWGALLHGARLVIHPPGQPDPHEVGRTLVRHRVAVAGMSTGLFHQLVESSLDSLAGARLVMPAGDVLSPRHARLFLEAHPQSRLLNGYGPTETTVTAAYHELRRVEPGRSIPIGRAEPHTALYVLDGEQRPVPDGEDGELYIGGDGVARGYLNRAELTRAAFLPDPFSADPEARMYRTGDRVRRRGDGELEFLGRADRQVKVRGYRVEPAEVEARLLLAPAVKQAFVEVREDRPGQRQLVAYVVLGAHGADRAGAVEAVRHRLAEELPAHLMPSAVIALDAFPLSGTGKIDRAALPAPHAAPGRRPYRPPQTPLERRLVELWRDALQIDDIGLDDNFFELGGDSLLAMRVVVRLHDEPGAELSQSALFEAPTPGALASLIEASEESGAARTLPPLRPRRRRGRYAPVSVSQAQVCFLSELDTESRAYQFQALLRLEGRLDQPALERALTEIVARHEIYRTTFPRKAGTWLQEIHAPFAVRLAREDLSGGEDPEAALERLAEAEFGKRIEVDQLPLVAWRLVRLAPERHVLLHVEHHLVHDGWSFMLFLDELRELYSAAVECRDARLAPCEIQYSDFADWQHELLEGDLAREQLDYWRRQLADAPDPLELPYDRAPDGRQTFQGGKVFLPIGADLRERLLELAHANDTTLFMTMLAAFVVLLHRYTGTRDLVVGSGLSNRRLRDSERLIGMLVNTVALRAELTGDPSVPELLGRIRRVALDAYANQDVPFERVVEAVSPNRSAAHSPLYQTLFSFHDSPLPGLDGAGLAIVPDELTDNRSSKAEVNVVAINHRCPAGEPAGELTVVWEYNSDLFDPETAERMAGHYERVLADFAAHPERRISELDVLTDGERRRLDELAGQAVPYERDASIAELFELRAREAPDAEALVGDGAALTYAELDARANRLAERLRGLGVTRGTRVGICLERSAAMVETLLAILKSGGTYVALDPAFPVPRLRLLAADAELPVICTESRFRGHLPGEVQLLCLDEAEQQPLAEPARGARPTASATDPAYIAYTSGSTGTPKGVEVTQRAVVRLVRGADYVELGRDQTLLALAPLSFDASTFEIWGALLNGGRLALAPAGSLSPYEIAAAVERHRVTTLWLTAGLFHRFVELEPESVGRLSQLVAGGDVLSPWHVRRALSLLPAEGVLVNGYGPTEGTTFSCCHRMRPGDDVPAPIPIGRPIANTTAHVLDEHGARVPVGVSGELCIGGDGVARGYLNQPQLTADRFVPDPFGANGARLYRTGDLVRWRRDETLEFIGRRDRQVKVRGFRIEPAEVEAELASHPRVREAVVVARGDGADERRLVGYVAGERLDRAELRAHLSTRVPAHLVPSAWVLLDRLPLTSSGKVDRAALPEPEPGRTGSRAAVADSLERAVAEIFEEVLEVRSVGPGDDFFDLGGHSLLAVRLFALVEERLGPRLPLATIFDAPTVEGIAAAARGKAERRRWSSLVPVASGGARPPFFAATAGDGNSVGFAALARALPEHQPFYALQPRGLDGRARMHTSVEAMARHYVNELRQVQPEGPYLLGGRCLGGLVAFEIARRLTEAGQEVALLGVFDSLGPRWKPRRLAPDLLYDEVLNMCRVRVRREDEAAAELRTPEQVERFVDWLLEPAPDAGEPVNRYVHEAYLARPDVQAAYPELPGPDAGRLVDWAWISGRSEMGLQPPLLPAASPAAHDAAPPPPAPASRWGPWAAAATDLLDVALRGRSRRLTARRDERLGEIALEAALRYRAGPYAGTVTLFRTAEFLDNIELARWHGVVAAEVDEHIVLGSHRSMLREPDVASLAATLDRCIANALGEDSERQDHTDESAA
jgi:amino acid adenylation domain-containing protein